MGTAQNSDLEARNRVLERVKRAAQAVSEARELLEIEIGRRDEIILEAVDQGATIRPLAQAAGLSIPGIYASIARVG